MRGGSYYNNNNNQIYCDCPLIISIITWNLNSLLFHILALDFHENCYKYCNIQIYMGKTLVHICTLFMNRVAKGADILSSKYYHQHLHLKSNMSSGNRVWFWGRASIVPMLCHQELAVKNFKYSRSHCITPILPPSTSSKNWPSNCGIWSCDWTVPDLIPHYSRQARSIRYMEMLCKGTKQNEHNLWEVTLCFETPLTVEILWPGEVDDSVTDLSILA